MYLLKYQRGAKEDGNGKLTVSKYLIDDINSY